jgi:hypothetical protein
MFSGVVTFERELSEREVAAFSQEWARAKTRSARREVLALFGAKYEQVTAKRPRAAFLRRARSRVR